MLKKGPIEKLHDKLLEIQYEAQLHKQETTLREAWHELIVAIQHDFNATTQSMRVAWRNFSAAWSATLVELFDFTDFANVPWLFKKLKGWFLY